MTSATTSIAIIGAGPAGLMAADVISQSGHSVDVFDTMPSVGRKFLLAGKGGLNLTHSEPADQFAARFGAGQAMVSPWLADFGSKQICEWAQSLGISTFIGTSGRVFPTDMKAAPLLRAWLQRLRNAKAVGQAEGRGSVNFHMRHRWTGWSADGALQFDSPADLLQFRAACTVLALGGASWARLGSDGAWVDLLLRRGVGVSPLQPANCGFDVQNGWSEHFSTRFAGQPFKSVAIRFGDVERPTFLRKGEFVATATGVEGSLIYAASSQLRDAIARHGRATFNLDLLPDRSHQRVLADVSHPRGSRSLSSHLKSRLGLDGIKSAILHELLGKADLANADKLAAAIKGLPVTLSTARPIDEAISTAGGVQRGSVTAQLMLKPMPGVFCAGEMLDWEAPTGGYLLSASLASGRQAGLGVVQYLAGSAAAVKPTTV